MNIIIPFVIALGSITVMVLFARMVIHCYKRYDKRWFYVVQPLHVLAYSVALLAVTEVPLLKNISFLVDHLKIIKVITVILAVIAIVHRLIRYHDSVGFGVNLGCLVIELFVSVWVMIFAAAAVMLIVFIVGLLIAFAVGISGASNDDGWKYHWLVCYATGKRDYVYSVNGNMYFLYSVNGTAHYTRSGDMYYSDEDNDIYILH